MLQLKPNFFVHTGDIVYYDQLAKTLPLARYHWQRTYSWPTNVEFHRQVASYFEKDDHDTWLNDCWPTMQTEYMHEFTFAEGQAVFSGTGREALGTLREFAETTSHSPLRADLARLNAGLYMLELCGATLAESDPHPQVFDLLHNALHRLGQADASPQAVLAYFQWRLARHVVSISKFGTDKVELTGNTPDAAPETVNVVLGNRRSTARREARVKVVGDDLPVDLSASGPSPGQWDNTREGIPMCL